MERHNVITHPNLVSLRIDESLYFANAGYLEDYYSVTFRPDHPRLAQVNLVPEDGYATAVRMFGFLSDKLPALFADDPRAQLVHTGMFQ